MSLFGSDQFWHQQNLPAMSLPLSLFWEKKVFFSPFRPISNLLPTPPVPSFYFSSLLINLGHAESAYQVGNWCQTQLCHLLPM